MTQIIVPQRMVWTRQPLRSVEIDWGNSLSRGLIGAWPLGATGSLTADGLNKGNTLTPGLGVLPKLVPDSSGLVASFSSGLSSEALAENVSIPFDAAKSYTWSFRTFVTSLSQMWMVSSTTMTVGAVWGFGCFDSTGIFRAYSGDASSRWVGNAGDVIAGKWQSWSVVYSGGIISAVYRDGKPLTPSSNTSTSAAGNAVGVSIGGNQNGFWTSFTGKISPVYLYNRALSSSEIRSLSANPWQIFSRRDRRTIIDFGASGGTSTVYADSALAYYIRSLLSSDSGIQYAIRNAIYKDDAVGYYLRSAIAQNSEVGYVLRSAIAKDDAESYKIRGLVQSSDAEAYSIRGLVQTSDSEAYKIRGQVQADTSASYDIQSSTSVASSNAVNYSVRVSVAASAALSYSVRGSVQKDTASAYSVRSAVSRDAAASYSVSASASSVYADSTASYSVDGVVPSGPSAESIAAAVLAALQATTIPVDTQKMNGHTIIGDGSESDPWRGVGVQP